LTTDAIDPALLARFRLPPGGPTDVRPYLTVRLLERAAGAFLADDGVLVVVGKTGSEYPQDLAVVDELVRLGWLELYDVDGVRVTPTGAYWSEKFGRCNRRLPV
jgi:hypothetical protein